MDKYNALEQAVRDTSLAIITENVTTLLSFPIDFIGQIGYNFIIGRVYTIYAYSYERTTIF